jgi:glucuronokinase
MRHFADLAEWGRDALVAGDTARLSALIDDNFNTRRSIYNLPPWQIEMVESARRTGASAKFAGSGGAVVGTYQGEAMFDALRTNLAAIGSRTIKPQVSG